MANKKRYNILNELMNIEFQAHYYYIQAAAWAASRNLDGCCNFFLKHAKEEYSHVMKIFQYLVDLGEKATFSDLLKSDINANDVEGIFSLVYEHEVGVTKAYDKAIANILEEKDNQIFCFLQWFASEQDEEMALCRRILDKIKLIGSGPHALYLLDQEMAKIASES
ncbi:Ferritin [Candidatus Liberibacter solanacearum]|uniref:ferritin n=1 Tax=Candidatus Liberibacter solanacearum TaxID=556287 RepID=UPI00387146B5